MGSNEKYFGSGQRIGEIDLGEAGVIEFVDDGDYDEFTNVTLFGPNGNKVFTAPRIEFSTRNNLDGGDKRFEEILENTDYQAPSTDDDNNKSSTWGRRQVSFKCDYCGKTWAGTKNKTPEDEEDTCPKCAD